MNSWYAVEQLGAAHLADLQREAAPASLAVSAVGAVATVGDRTMSPLRRAARGAAIALVRRLASKHRPSRVPVLAPVVTIDAANGAR